MSVIVRSLSALAPVRFKRLSPLDLLGLHRQRRELGRLDPHLLADIGVDADSAAAEADRPFWDVPQTWRR